MSIAALFLLSTTAAQAETIYANKTGWTPVQALAELNAPIQVDAKAETITGGMIALGQDAKGVTTAISWEFELVPMAEATKSEWLAVADTDSFLSVDAFVHDAMRGDLVDALSVGDTIYGQITGPDDDSQYLVVGIVSERNHIEGMGALELYNKSVYTARAVMQISEGAAKAATGTPWGMISGTVDVVGGVISVVICWFGDEPVSADGNVLGMDDVEDAVIDALFSGAVSAILEEEDEETTSTDDDDVDDVDPDEADDTDTDTDCDDSSADCEGEDEDEDDKEKEGATIGDPDFENDVDSEAMEQFLALSAWLGIDPYNTGAMEEALTYVSDLGDKDTVDVAYMELGWLDYGCVTSTDLCLGAKEGTETDFLNLTRMETLCDSDLCSGALKGGTLTDSALETLDTIRTINAADAETVESFEISQK